MSSCIWRYAQRLDLKMVVLCPADFLPPSRALLAGGFKDEHDICPLLAELMIAKGDGHVNTMFWGSVIKEVRVREL